MDDITVRGPCPRCGQPLAPDAPESLCAACLLTAGMETFGASVTAEALTMTSDGVLATRPAADVELTEGVAWGPYRIGRLLGRGGMGEVYEAEHLDSGRCVALKVLRTRLQGADARARFLLEGQLAASISHPHTVYIFGSDEIAGTPVISMELLPGGTLKDRVTAEGPLPPSEAVSAVLDILGGLDAAHAAGILHRDIKPSNCFIDRDGTVKVGDFGLSISTLARDVRHDLTSSGFQGTPQFAPPEQLRGEPLDLRADIYAVGATLYYLLTGRPPFEAPDLRTLVTRVLSEPVPSARQIRPEIPGALAAIVTRCLAKSAADRPASYAALAEALRPFSARHDRPARPGPRFVAGMLDSALLAVPSAAMTMTVFDPVSGTTAAAATFSAWAWLLNFTYFLVLEGRWGASLGKRVLGLRVVSEDGSTAPVRRIALRTSIVFLGSFVVGIVGLSGLVTVGGAFDAVRMPVLVAVAIALFLTARRRNGWAAVHDLVSGTRVVARVPVQRRQTALRDAAPADGSRPSTPARRCGPYTVVAETGDRLIAIDPVLRRRVWIHRAASGAPLVSAARRDLTREGRLHWLSGRRSANEQWDAYEAPDGGPLLAQADVSWASAKRWLTELARELAEASRDGSMPVLRLDRLWVRDDGRLVLLDFEAPGTNGEIAHTGGGPDLTPVGLVIALATHVLRRARVAAGPPAVPLSARTAFDRWTTQPPASIEDAHAQLAALAAAHDHVRSGRRALPILLASAPVVLLLLLSLLLLPPLFRFMANPQTVEILSGLQILSAAAPPAGSRFGDPEIRDALERYLAGRHGQAMRDEAFWNRGAMRDIQTTLRPIAAGILERHPDVSPEELARVSDVLAPEIARWATRSSEEQAGGLLQAGGIIASTLSALALAVALVCGLVSSMLVPGGVMLRQLGYAVVTREGLEIGRLRSVARSAAAWAPGIVWLIYLAASPKIQVFVPAPPRPILAMSLALGTLALGALWTIRNPQRGPHDLVAGTWVVPR